MKKILFLLFNLCGIFIVQAQKFELGLQAGICNYWGDLAPKVKLSETKGTAGFFGRLNFNHTWALKGEFNHYSVSGSDKNFEVNAPRNLSFRSGINELAVILEFNYLKYGPFVLHKKITSYVYAGIAGFTFNPQAKLKDKYYDLRDYQTENVLYNKFSMAIPFGIGIKYMLSNKFAIEGQLGFRKTFTDHLDDVSTVYPGVNASDAGTVKSILTDRSVELYGTPQNKLGYRRGNPDYKDWYMSCTVSIAMRIHTRIKCARFF
ncbi:MAG: DUF6089 family protein [Bacteroidota bacterium]|nr:DUF6089 family protein [Bacteroidota bacterium]